MDISALVFLHITAGAFAIAAGGAALMARKGEALHRTAGSVFFIAMIAMCTAALPVAIARHQSVNVAATSFTLYLISTAWMAAHRWFAYC